MPPVEQTHPFYRPAIDQVAGEGAILWAAPQSLSPEQKSQARSNMGLGNAATMNSSAIATEAAADELVRGDDPRLVAVAEKANLDGGKLALSELPDRATMVVLETANQASRLALSSAAVIGRIVKQLDSGAFHILKTGGNPTLLVDWEEINTPVTLGSIGGLEAFVVTFLGSGTTVEARAAIGLGNVSDVPSTQHAQIAGNLRIGSATKYLAIAVSIAENFTVNAPYTSTVGTYYLALSPNADGSLALANITGLTAALGLKADLVSGKVPLSQLPDVVGALTVSVGVADQVARYAMTPEAARGKIVVQADEKTSWMLVSGGNPSTPTDWLQVGDTEITAGQITDATSVGLSVLMAATVLAAQQAVQLDPTRVPTFAGLKVSLGSTDGLAFAVGTASNWKNVLPPATMSGSGWTLPNRAGYLAWSPNVDGSLSGGDIAGGNPTFGTVTITARLDFASGIGARFTNGAFYTQVSAGTLTAIRSFLYPNGSGYGALTASVSGRIVGSVDVEGWSDKADLVDGKIPLAQLPAGSGGFTESRVVADATARLALSLSAARGDAVVQQSDDTVWMLRSGGDPAVQFDWYQIGIRDRGALSGPLTDGIHYDRKNSQWFPSGGLHCLMTGYSGDLPIVVGTSLLYPQTDGRVILLDPLSVESLDFEGIDLSASQLNVAGMTSLTELNLMNTAINILPNFVNLPALTVLKAEGDFTAVPELSELAILYELRLIGNFTNVPDLSALVGMQIFDMRGAFDSDSFSGTSSNILDYTLHTTSLAFVGAPNPASFPFALLIDLQAPGLPTSEVDAFIIGVAANAVTNGINNGSLRVIGATGPSVAADGAIDDLLGLGWTIITL